MAKNIFIEEEFNFSVLGHDDNNPHFEKIILDTDNRNRYALLFELNKYIENKFEKIKYNLLEYEEFHKEVSLFIEKTYAGDHDFEDHVLKQISKELYHDFESRLKNSKKPTHEKSIAAENYQFSIN